MQANSWHQVTPALCVCSSLYRYLHICNVAKYWSPSVIAFMLQFKILRIKKMLLHNIDWDNVIKKHNNMVARSDLDICFLKLNTSIEENTWYKRLRHGLIQISQLHFFRTNTNINKMKLIFVQAAYPDVQFDLYKTTWIDRPLSQTSAPGQVVQCSLKACFLLDLTAQVTISIFINWCLQFVLAFEHEQRLVIPINIYPSVHITKNK